MTYNRKPAPGKFLWWLQVAVVVLLGGVLLLSGCVPTAPGASTGTFSSDDTVNLSFDVSPDGRYMLFPAAGNGLTDLYRMDMTTRKVQRLTDMPENEVYPRFSPDGRYIAFCAAMSSSRLNRHTPESHLYLYDLANKKIKQVTQEKDRFDECPSFSADGKFLVFDGSQSQGSDVFVVEIATGKVRRLTSRNYNSMLRPRFWREDREVVFTAYKHDEKSLGMYQATVPVSGKSTQKPTPITPQGKDWGKCHSAQPVAGGKLLMVSNLVDADGNDYVCLYDPTHRTFDSIISSNHGPTDPVLVGSKVYWMEGEWEIYCIDRSSASGKQTLITDSSLFDKPM